MLQHQHTKDNRIETREKANSGANNRQMDLVWNVMGNDITWYHWQYEKRNKQYFLVIFFDHNRSASYIFFFLHILWIIFILFCVFMLACFSLVFVVWLNIFYSQFVDGLLSFVDASHDFSRLLFLFAWLYSMSAWRCQ